MPNKDELVITRIINAPRERVFKAWTDPKQLVNWWAPKDCATPYCTVDLRPGGKFHYCMRMPDGNDIWGIGIYREIIEPEKIVYTDSFADKDGNPVSPEQYGISSSHPAESTVTVEFTEHGDKTKLTIIHEIPAYVKEREQTGQGWNDMLDNLDKYLTNN